MTGLWVEAARSRTPGAGLRPLRHRKLRGRDLGVGNLAKTGSGTLVLQGANIFSGVTAISGGSLVLANSGALAMSTLVAPSTGVSFDQSVSGNAFTLGASAVRATSPCEKTLSTAIALSVGGNGANMIYFGSLSGSGSLIYGGTGLMILTGSSNFSGGNEH